MRRDVTFLFLAVLLLSAAARDAAACQGSHECAFNEYCAVTDKRGECAPLPQRRTPCKGHDDCGEKSWCDPLHLICMPDRARPPSRIGKSCDPEMENFCGSETSCCEISGDFFCEIDCP